MTDKEKERIAHYRREGYGYTEIPKLMNLSVECVRTYCKRNGLGGVSKTKNEASYCEECGTAIQQIPSRKHKRFCSDKCRMAWWNTHKDSVKKRANYSLLCEYCGNAFISYGNKKRKYCSHECYIKHRFGGENGQ